MNTSVIVIAIVVILALAGYAGWLWSKVYKRQQQQKKQQLAQEAMNQQKEQDHQKYLIESIGVISQSAVNGELNISEACIRLKVLIDNLNVDDQQKQPFSILNEVYEQLQQFHTHDARMRLSKKERTSEDRKRHFIELKNEAELQAVFAQLTHTKWQLNL